MEVKNLIQASADIITIARVKPGDVYKRVDDSSYQGTTLRLGVIQSVMNNGTDTAITAIEIQPNYGTLTVEHKVFSQGEYALFPATPEEIAHHFSKCIDAAERAIETAEVALTKAKEDLENLHSLKSMHQRNELTIPETATELLEVTGG